MKEARFKDLHTARITIAGRLRGMEPALRQIGAVLVSQGQRAFETESFGDEPWPERYPSQSEPFINVAGAVADLTAGGSVKARRFQRRPVLSDTGLLRGSLAWRLAGSHAVEAGSVVPYAGLHQHGGESSQPVTATTKKGLIAFLKSKRGKPYRGKLGWLLNRKLGVTSLTTKVHARPFLGITKTVEEEIVGIIEAHVAEGERAA